MDINKDKIENGREVLHVSGKLLVRAAIGAGVATLVGKKSKGAKILGLLGGCLIGDIIGNKLDDDVEKRVDEIVDGFIEKAGEIPDSIV